MANRTILEEERATKPSKSTKKTPNGSSKAGGGAERERVLELFRRWGFYESNLDPLGFLEPVKRLELNVTGRTAAEARAIYCGTVGAEFMHLPEQERRQWIAERLESPAAAVDQRRILERLIRADLFEQVLQARYLGAKRFSLEGVTALIPLLDALLETAGGAGGGCLDVCLRH